jgi:hypothetical protein
MRGTRQPLSKRVLCGIVVALLAGCSSKDSISQAAKTDTTKPGIAETKAIAEEGFIYGLPIVMNYAVMYAYAVDRNSGQFKAPFNQIFNEARVFTYEDTAIVTPNSDTPYSFLWMDLRAEPLVLSVPAVPKSRYYSVQLEDGNTFNFGYIGSRATGNEAGDYMVVGPDWKGATPPGIKKVFHATTQFALAGYRTQLFNAADMPNVVKVQAGYKAQPLSAYLKQPAPPAALQSIFPRSTRSWSRRTSSSTSTSRCSSHPQGRRRRRSERSWPVSASVPASASTSRIFRSSTRRKSPSA